MDVAGRGRHPLRDGDRRAGRLCNWLGTIFQRREKRRTLDPRGPIHYSNRVNAPARIRTCSIWRALEVVAHVQAA